MTNLIFLVNNYQVITPACKMNLKLSLSNRCLRVYKDCCIERRYKSVTLVTNSTYFNALPVTSIPEMICLSLLLFLLKSQKAAIKIRKNTLYFSTYRYLRLILLLNMSIGNSSNWLFSKDLSVNDDS